MKLFIDTANVEEIRKANDLGVICGVTTNPSLIAKEGRIFEEVVITDSIPLKEEMNSPKVTVLSLAPMLAKIIEHIELGLPLTIVYDMFVEKI